MNAFSSDASFEIIYRPKYLNLSLPEEGVLLVDYFTEKFGADKAKKYMEETPKYMTNLVCRFWQLELWLRLAPFVSKLSYCQYGKMPQRVDSGKMRLKVARYSFSGPIPPEFEHKLRRHKQSFGKIATTVVLDKDENLL